MKRPRVLSTTPAGSISARLLTAVAVVATAYYRLSLPFFLLCLYLLYLLWSYYWAWASCRSVAAEYPTLQENVFAGETFSRDYKFFNTWFLPLVRCGISFYLPSQFSCFGDISLSRTSVDENVELAVSPEHIYPSWHFLTASYAWVGEQKTTAVSLKIKPNSRGIYWLPPPQFFVGEPSGLFRGTMEAGTEQLLYVFPELKNTEVMLKSFAFEEQGRKDIFGLEDRYQPQGIRDYQSSDSVKSINWYATARTGSLKTNIHERKESAYCLVALDVTMTGQSSYITNSIRVHDPLLEEIISLTAGIALFHIEQGARTAFLTNAPRLQWEKGNNSEPGPRGPSMRRIRKVSALDFSAAAEQAQNILELCASIDENGRAFPEAQEKLWSKIVSAPAQTIIYLLCCHSPPPGWQKTEAYDDRAPSDPSQFYSPRRLSRLASSTVKLINLSGVNYK